MLPMCHGSAGSVGREMEFNPCLDGPYPTCMPLVQGFSTFPSLRPTYAFMHSYKDPITSYAETIRYTIDPLVENPCFIVDGCMVEGMLELA